MKTHHFIRFLLLSVPLAIMLSTPQQRYVPGFFADEAVYYSMIQSLATDGDLLWTRNDLESICQVYPAGPVGVILRKDSDGSIVYAKPVIYPLIAAFFFLFLGPKGILCLNYLCFWAIFRWLSIYWGDTIRSTLFAAGSLCFTSFLPFTLWIHPEIFAGFLIAGYCCNWMLRNHPDRKHAYIWMALYLATVTAIKPPLILLGLLVLVPVFRERKWRQLSIFLCLIILMLALTIVTTGQINPYEGYRKIFHTAFPLDSGVDGFGSGDSWSSANATFYFNHNVVGWNLFYFLFGRFSGVVWYFFPGLWLAIHAIFAKSNRNGRLLLSVCALICLIQVVMIPSNYHGGGGTLGNRYFVILYPMLLFALPKIPQTKRISAGLVIGALLSGAFLIHPWNSSYQPGEFTKSGLFSRLPVEWTLAGAYPIFDPSHYRVSFSGIDGHFHFLDRSSSGKAGEAFKVFTGAKTNFIVELTRPVDRLEFYIKSTEPQMTGILSSGNNSVEILANSQTETRVILPMGTGHHRTDIYGIDQWVHQISCKVEILQASDESSLITRPAIVFQTTPTKRSIQGQVVHQKKK